MIVALFGLFYVRFGSSHCEAKRVNFLRAVITSFWDQADCIDFCLARERGGLVVECRTPEREVGGSKSTLYSPKVLVNYPGSGGSVPT